VLQVKALIDSPAASYMLYSFKIKAFHNKSTHLKFNNYTLHVLYLARDEVWLAASVEVP